VSILRSVNWVRPWRVAMVGAAAVVAAVLPLAGCDGSARTPRSTVTNSRSVSPSAGGTSASQTVDVVLVGDRADGHTVTLMSGQRLRVVLSSTYWQFDRATNNSVLRPGGQPRVESESTSCVPGGGCGTVTATFIAAARGSAEIVAHRSSCGEAMGCTGDTGRFRLHVVVSS
jgi:hypothetical protein